MNLTKFLSEIDKITEQRTRAQLKTFVMETGRILPEQKREDFLRRLKEQDESTGTKTKKSGSDADFSRLYDSIKKSLEEIEDGEAGCIEEVYNEEYDDWYDNGDEIFFEDHTDISDTLAEACDFLHRCMDEEKYKEGFDIGERLFSIRIPTDGEYIGDVLNLHDMVIYQLLHCNMENVALDALYCGYFSIPLKERPERLYSFISNSGVNEISMERLMQHGDEELPDFDRFLEAWIQYLGNKTGNAADRLFTEGIGLLNDIEKACMIADKCIETHPGLYFNILQNDKSRGAGDLIHIGMGALDKIPVRYTVRSRIALLTAEYIIKTNEKQELIEKCYYAAFESDTNAVNYLRALLNGFDGAKDREMLQSLFKYRSAGRHTSFSHYWYDSDVSEREENDPDSEMILALKFFDGDFSAVLSSGLEMKKTLGWTGTFMKQGIALYLLAIYDGKWQTKPMLRMANLARNEIIGRR